MNDEAYLAAENEPEWEEGFRRYSFVKRCVHCSACGQLVSVVDGADLRRVRLEAGLSLREMGKRIGVSVAYLSDVELNRRGCTRRVEKVYEAVALSMGHVTSGGPCWCDPVRIKP